MFKDTFKIMFSRNKIKNTMSKLYQFTSIFIIILFFTGCGGSNIIKKDPGKTTTSTKTQPMTLALIAAMSTDEKLKQAEQLFDSALSSKDIAEKNNRLSNALLICTQLLVDAHQTKLLNIQSASEISLAQYDYSLQLAQKIMSQLNDEQLSDEQNNQYILASAAISLTNYQTEKTLSQLNNDFDSIQNTQWSLYYQIRAMAEFQLGEHSKAVKALIIRQGYLTSEQAVQANLNLIWNYLAGVNISEQININNQSAVNDKRSSSDEIYLGWLELARALRDSKDPQTMNHAINFWFQSYPAHPADRTFVNNILQLRQESILQIRHIAVLLPQQGKLAKPAKAIRDGIMASHYKSSLSSNIQLRFYDTANDDHIWLTYQQAIDDGADFVIGPLAKSNLEVLSESAELSVPTLALNSLEQGSGTSVKPNNLFQFGLSPESAARMVAEKGRQDGHYYAAVMVPDNHWGERMKKAFSSHWKASGGIVVESIDYKSEQHDFSESIKSMLNIDASVSRKKEVSRTIGRKLEFTPRRRQDIDMLFMAALPRQAKQIPLQIIYHHGETIPVYSTSHIVANYHNPRRNIDMDGVIFSDMPFLLGAVQNTASEENTYQNTLYQRLFAMGVDSYQLAPYVDYLYKNPSESFSGDTGKISIHKDGHIIRSLPWAIFDQGNIMLQSISSNAL